MRVRLAWEEGLALLAWSRRGRRNAFDRAAVASLTAALADLAAVPPPALVLWGEGGDFSSGADLTDVRALADAGREEAVAYSAAVQALTRAVEEMPVPVVAAVEGACLGLGLEVALAASWRVADPAARLGLPEMRHGLYPAAGGTLRLAERVGEGRSRRLILEAAVLSAAEALAMDLVEELSPPGGALAAARARARALAAPGAAAVRFLAVRRAGRGEGWERALLAEREGFADLVRRPEVASRIDAFLVGRRRAQDAPRPPTGGEGGPDLALGEARQG